MAAIGLIGPHAVGKTTAVRRWALKYPRLLVALADNQREATREDFDLVMAHPPNVREWKLDKQQKISRARYHLERRGVSVIESARGFSTWLSAFGPTDPVIVLTCPEPQGRQWLLERRLASERVKDKSLPEFWTEKRLEYECSGHLLNFARNHLQPNQWAHFEIIDREQDWAAVDEHFSCLYRRLNNQLNRMTS